MSGEKKGKGKKEKKGKRKKWRKIREKDVDEKGEEKIKI